MKKSRLLCAVLATFMMTACEAPWSKKKGGEEETPAKKWDLEPEITGGTEEEKNAILDAINNKPICNQNGTSTAEIFPENKPTLTEDAGDGIKITLSQVSGSYTVKLTWTIDETQPYFGSRLHSDAAHDIIEIAYKGYGVADGEFTWTLSKIECGDAVAANANIVYKAICKNQEYKHDDVRLTDVYAITEGERTIYDLEDNTKVLNKWPSFFDIIDYEPQEGKSTYSPYFRTNNPGKQKEYLYYNIPAKAIYLAPDGNWGLLAEGKNVLEFYAGSGTALNAKNWPNLGGEYVTVSANMGQYCGNLQFGFVTKIAALSEAQRTEMSFVEPENTFLPITEELISSLILTGYTAQKQAVRLSDGSCLSNKLGEVTGTFVSGSLKDSNGEDTTVSKLASSKRFTFELKVGEKKLQVAYDYHTDKEGKVGVFNALKEAISSGQNITVKGTMRYSGNNSSPFISEGNNGVWSIVPFLPAHATHAA